MRFGPSKSNIEELLMFRPYYCVYNEQADLYIKDPDFNIFQRFFDHEFTRAEFYDYFSMPNPEYADTSGYDSYALSSRMKSLSEEEFTISLYFKGSHRGIREYQVHGIYNFYGISILCCNDLEQFEKQIKIKEFMSL